VRTLALILAFAHLLCSCKTSSYVATQDAVEQRNEERRIKVTLTDGAEISCTASNRTFQEAFLDSTLHLNNTQIGTLNLEIDRIQEIRWTKPSPAGPIGGGAIIGGLLMLSLVALSDGAQQGVQNFATLGYAEPEGFSTGVYVSGFIIGAVAGGLLGSSIGSKTSRVPINGSFETYASYFSPLLKN